MAGPKTTSDSKQASKGMHRRSRTGCFTCRLRRKKCDEGRSVCKACRNLGLECQYKRPHWWSNNDARRAKKEDIKNKIKHKKLQEKAAQQGTMTTTNTPPSLCHSIRTSREASLGSQLSGDFNFNQYTTQDLFSSGMMAPPQFAPAMPYVAAADFSPYEIDVKTECQTFVNDVETRRESTISSFSGYPMLPAQGFEEDATWVQSEFHESRRESFVEEPFLDSQLWELPHAPFSPQHNATIQVEQNDQYLLEHFLKAVVPLIFPVLEANQNGSARRDIILPALESNEPYLHCCLSASALHLKTTRPELATGDLIDADIQRHRWDAINGLVQALDNIEFNHEQTLEATLAMIFFQSSIGRHDDSLQDIPWHAHFSAAKDLINRLELSNKMLAASSYGQQPPFNMTLASWIDILGATMIGRTPVFADTYREKNIANSSAGLAELMGCDDKIMFTISEIACLEAMSLEGKMDEVSICTYIKMLGDQISLTESTPDTTPEFAYAPNGAFRPKQLIKNITHVFRIAARIYLCSLVPDFDRSGQHIINLVAQLADAMEYIPTGETGHDRSLVWPLVIAGSVSLADSPFRTMFEHRSQLMGDAAMFGSFGRTTQLLKTVWQFNDEAFAKGQRKGLHWREAMGQKGWDFLLI
ncbi:hypothetical protein NA57DRAFT_39466 [Rhizodiscina lignyota]|uniref:Zn(2)-C6 fungal-type domain-containing protein n=1 Tax=Rhizodiscina lignyota TaxID=1504668 RepID=A0A9P4IH53_9PEZI|nr:hypothetical protein NA57DRAFT_39466 [Rhizodiscina lignyota]